MSELHDEPSRWLEGGGPDGLDADLLDALEATQGDFASDAQLADAEARLMGVIGGGGGGGGGPGGEPPAGVPEAAASTSQALPAALLASGVVIAGLVAFYWPSEEAVVPPAPVAQEPVVDEEVEEEAETEPASPVEAESAALVAPEPTPEAEPTRPASRTLDEGELLERARRRVRSRPAAALRILSTHRARFPDGVLAEERDALWIEALHGRGREAEARAAFDRFGARYPRSVHRVRLRSLFE